MNDTTPNVSIQNHIKRYTVIKKIQQEKDDLEQEIVGLKGSISELENQRNTLLSQLEISQSTDKIKECQIQNMMQKVAKQTEIQRALDEAMNESSDIKKQNESLETKVAEKDKEIKIIRKTSDSAIADLAQKVVEIESFITVCFMCYFLTIRKPSNLWNCQ